MSNPVFNMSELDDSGAVVLSDSEEVGGNKDMVELGDSDDEQATQVINPASEVKAEGGTAPLPNGNGTGLNGDGGAEGMEVEDSGKPASPPPFNTQWRTTCSNTSEKMAFALENRRLFHDAVFLVGEDKEEITGHKTILGICSSVFEELFFGAGTENEPKTDEVYEFIDQEPSAFKAMLKFLYTSVFDVSLWNAIGVMRAARAFDVPELLARTGEFLKRNLTEKNAITFYQAAQLFQEKHLEEAAFDFLLNNFWAVAKTDDFLNITFSNLCKFLDQDEINISELDFFNSVLRWAQHECERQDMKDTSENLRSVLSDALALVRFTLMSPKEFALQVVPKFILSPIEVITIFQHLSVELEERDGLPEVFCKSESRKKLRQSNPNLLVQNLKSTRLRVRVRPCDRFVSTKPVPVATPPAPPTPAARKRPSYH